MIDVRAHTHPVLFFSAGKDSLALLLLLSELLDDITVVWANPGSPHERTLQYMRRIAAEVPKFVTLHGRQPEWVKRFGHPADVVPARCTVDGRCGNEPDILVQPFYTCCWENLWKPMKQYIEACGTTLVIRGQRHDESLKNNNCDAEVSVVDGVTYWHPLHNWSEADVYAYLDRQGVGLPPFYADGARSSVDCWDCTAYLDRGTLDVLARVDPAKHAYVAMVVRRMALQLQRESAPIRTAVEAHHE